MLWFFFWLRNSFQICVKSAKQEKRPGSSEQRLILIPYFLFLWHLYLYFHLYFLSLRQKLVREDKWSAHLPNIASQFVFVFFNCSCVFFFYKKGIWTRGLWPGPLPSFAFQCQFRANARSLSPTSNVSSLLSSHWRLTIIQHHSLKYNISISRTNSTQQCYVYLCNSTKA